MLEDLERLKRRIEAVQNAKMFDKVTAAELALHDALYLLETLVAKVNQLECEETPF